MNSPTYTSKLQAYKTSPSVAELRLENAWTQYDSSPEKSMTERDNTWLQNQISPDAVFHCLSPVFAKPTPQDPKFNTCITKYKTSSGEVHNGGKGACEHPVPDAWMNKYHDRVEKGEVRGYPSHVDISDPVVEETAKLAETTEYHRTFDDPLNFRLPKTPKAWETKYGDGRIERLEKLAASVPKRDW